MKITNPPKPLTLPASIIAGRKKACSEEGVIPARMDRFCSDKKIFPVNRKKRNGNTGTVLIDVSGSMRLEAENILTILEKLPLAKIAMYSSDGNLNGELRILGDKGKRVKDKHLTPYGGGNGVDGPALKWLNKQPFPHIWICDGQVTGKHDQSTPNLAMEAEILARRGRVQRIDNVDYLDKVKM